MPRCLEGVTTSRAAETAAIMRALPDEKHDPPGADFDAVYAALWAPITRFAHLVVGSREVGEELTQEAFVGLLRHFDRVENPQAYLRRSIVNRASRHRGRALRERVLLATAREPVQLAPEFDEAWALLTRLPPRQRAVLVLPFYDDLSEAEIARVLGCRPGTVKSLSSRGLDRLRKDLA